eukprot:757175-Hanusia_phi.AAC.12
MSVKIDPFCAIKQFVYAVFLLAVMQRRDQVRGGGGGGGGGRGGGGGGVTLSRQKTDWSGSCTTM